MFICGSLAKIRSYIKISCLLQQSCHIHMRQGSSQKWWPTGWIIKDLNPLQGQCLLCVSMFVTVLRPSKTLWCVPVVWWLLEVKNRDSKLLCPFRCLCFWIVERTNLLSLLSYLLMMLISAVARSAFRWILSHREGYTSALSWNGSHKVLTI